MKRILIILGSIFVALYSFAGLKPNPIAGAACWDNDYYMVSYLLNQSGKFQTFGGIFDNLSNPYFMTNQYKTEFDQIVIYTYPDCYDSFKINESKSEEWFVERLAYKSNQVIGYDINYKENNEKRRGYVVFEYNTDGKLKQQTICDNNGHSDAFLYSYNNNKELERVDSYYKFYNETEDYTWSDAVLFTYSNGKASFHYYNSDGKLTSSVNDVMIDGRPTYYESDYLFTGMKKTDSDISYWYYEYNSNGYLTKITHKNTTRIYYQATLTYNEHSDLVKVVKNNNAMGRNDIISIDYTYIDTSANPLVDKDDHLWKERRIKIISKEQNKNQTVKYIVQRGEYYKGSNDPITE